MDFVEDQTVEEAIQDLIDNIHEDTESGNRQPLDTFEEQRLGLTEALPPNPPSRPVILERPGQNNSPRPSVRRPVLTREGSVPSRIPPPSAPPPAPPISAPSTRQAPLRTIDNIVGYNEELTTFNDTPQDSQQFPATINIQQLRDAVPAIPILEPTPYAFSYSDTATLPEEIEEWFSYNVEERARILKVQSSFAQEWASANGWIFLEFDNSDGGWSPDWTQVPEIEREKFLSRLLGLVRAEKDLDKRLRALEALTYLCLGAWKETAGLKTPDQPTMGSSIQVTADKESAKLSKARDTAVKETYGSAGLQLKWIKANITMLFECDGLQTIYDLVRQTCMRDCELGSETMEKTTQYREAEARETWCALTIFYLSLELARADELQRGSLQGRSRVLQLTPAPAVFLCDVINRVRWDDAIKLPLVKILLLLWKTSLVCLGDLSKTDAAKDSFKTGPKNDPSKGPMITASPLDYHTFRQEITSKYPAYVPPVPVFPIEPDAKSILPPLRAPTDRRMQDPNAAQSNYHGTSILNQPVHIATPAPSPPPSPAVGKGGKKQNYQTNQNFPFLYPPLDASSNQLGGKGSTDLQDALAGRKWEGSDIPASILEAADLFSKRMRATRAMKQLWEERVRFMKFERGWAPQQPEDDNDSDSDVEGFDLKGKLEELGLEDSEDEENDSNQHEKLERSSKQAGSRFDDNPVDRLNLVEDFYRESMPHLQSVVMVLLKTVLASVTSLITQTNGGQNGVGANSFHMQDPQNGLGGRDDVLLSNWINDAARFSEDDIETVRGQEITAKAASGILILLLKWFKVSHILKFEYLTQLLVDANYIPIILKLFQIQEIERIISHRTDRPEHNFFTYCRSNSNHPPKPATSFTSNEDSDFVDQSTADQPLNDTNGHPSDPSALDDSSQDFSSDDEDDAAPPPIRRHRSPPLPPSSSSPEDMLDSVNDENPMDPPLPSYDPNIPPEVDELGLPQTPLPPSPISTYNHRSLLTHINLLRVLQKLCKGKTHRNLLLVTYKSAAYLRKLLRLPIPLLRLYTLKLFKNQVPYCGRKWRQSNMRVITAVYLRCRPSLRDEWLCGGSVEVDGEVENAVPMEQSLRSLTHYYNIQRYPTQMGARKGMLNEERDFFVRELEKLDWEEDFAEEGSGAGEGGRDVEAEITGWEDGGNPLARW